MLRRWFVACALIVVTTGVALEAEAQTGRFVPRSGGAVSLYDVQYAAPEGESLFLDLHLPTGDGPHPVIVWLHTGAWITGEKSGGPALRQVKRGYAVASVEYRLAPSTTFPGQIHDAKAAVRWLRANAARWHLDSDRIGVFGASAGGHLAALLGTSGGIESLEGTHGNQSESSRVIAVIDYYGPTDLLKLSEQAPPCMLLDPDLPWAPPSLFIGCPIQSCPEETGKSNPIAYLTPDDPPFLIVQGTDDCLVPWQQSQLLHDALRAAGMRSTFKLLEGAQHGGSEFETTEIRGMVDEFLDINLRGKRAPSRGRPVRRP